MRVLLLGATGNLGSRLLSSLTRRGHTVVTFVRTPSKLAPIDQKSVIIEQGDAKSSIQIKDAAVRHNCDAIVNTAGHAAMAPWGKSDLPTIVDAIIKAAIEIGEEHKSPIRVWFLGGQGIMDIPTRNQMIVNYMPLFREHVSTWKKLKALSPTAISWSILCPGLMKRAEQMKPIATEGSADNISVAADSPPEWTSQYLSIPLIGGYLNILSQISSYTTSYEDSAEFIADDLSSGESNWVLQRVGLKRKI